MPITFKMFLNFPASYDNRNITIPSLRTSTFIMDTKVDNNILSIIGKVGNHTQIFELSKSKTLLNSEVKLYCDCESFKYEFYYVLLKHGCISKQYTHIFESNNALLSPKKKNIHNIVSGCKHIISLANEINRQQHKHKIIRDFFSIK